MTCKKNAKTSADVFVKEEVTVHHKREEVLRNTRNKAQSIKLSSRYIKEDSHTALNCVDDADTQIVETALRLRM